MPKAKVIATLGPSTFSRNSIYSCIEAGMDIARLNMSHSDKERDKTTIQTLNGVSRFCWRDIPIQFDLKGSSVRINTRKPVDIIRGMKYRLSSVDTGDCIRVYHDDFHRKVKLGSKVLLDDGKIHLRVKKISGRDVYCVPINSGKLLPNKSMYVPGANLGGQTLTEKDWKDIQFGAEMGVKYFAVSFVKRAKDVEEVRDFLRNFDADTEVIAKIESPEPLKHLGKIIRESDGVMVARGDMGVTMPLETVPVHQYRIIKECNRLKKFVITATDMMSSMIDRPSPTRAEVNDVFMSIAAGSDALLLSNETAMGKYPAETISTMKRIMDEAEKESSLKIMKSIWN